MGLPRTFPGILLALSLCATFAADPSAPPVTTARGKAADLVRQWWAEGTAAGNIGDFYDNRDRGHRELNLTLFPQLSKVSYSSNELAARLDYAAARSVRTNVVLGNSSTSARAIEGGSNPRVLYTRPGGVPLLYSQYTHNNLFAYPEHQDHDPGHNGTPGYGDLFPLNTPCLYISQGSSGSEMAFLEATVLTLAAFQPDVKRRLIDKGLLMPTVQMLLRRSYKPAPETADYLTGKAHPTVFDSSLIDAAAMVQGAHLITPDTLPPLVQLRVLQEIEPRPRVEFFDFATSEKLCDTPAAIGRVFRGARQTRRMVVSAETSLDPNLRPLSWRWAILRGDPARIAIKPLNPDSSRVEITVAHHERRPIEPGSPMESSRVDIGCFAHNGQFYSAPAFICFYSLDSEARGYGDDGKIIDIGYGAGVTSVSISDWNEFFDLCQAGGAPAQFLQTRLPESDWNTVLAAREPYARLSAELDDATGQEKSARKLSTDAARRLADLEKKKGNDADLAAARDAAKAAESGLKTQTARRIAAAAALESQLAPARAVLDPLISRWLANPDFTFTHRRDLERVYAAASRAARSEFERGKDLLVQYGLLKKRPGFDFELTPLRSKPGPLLERLTPFERILVERLNGAAISLLVLHGAAQSKFTENYVDPTLSARKDWRDVYNYNDAGAQVGWTRYSPQGNPAEFNVDGLLVVGSKSTPVRYEVKPESGRRSYRMQWSRAN